MNNFHRLEVGENLDQITRREGVKIIVLDWNRAQNHDQAQLEI